MFIGQQISGRYNPIRRSLALAIPLTLMFAWAGCFVVCADNISGDQVFEHTKKFEQSAGDHLIEGETADECGASSNKIVIQERQDLKAPATAVVSAASFALVPMRFDRTVRPQKIPRNSLHFTQNKLLFLKHCSILI